MTSPRPHTLSTLTPYFTVEDADALITFVTGVFEGTVLAENRYEDGRVQHARIRIGDSVMMLNQASSDYVANVSQTHVIVADVEATYAAALHAGATSVMAPNLRPHGAWMAGVTDPCDNIWWIAGAVETL